MSEILFRRGGGWHDRLRAYHIFVDGKDVGHIRANSNFTVAVSPGRHQIELRIAWCSSPTMDIIVDEGKTAVVSCGPNAKFFLELLYISFLRHDYVWVRRDG